MSDKRTPIGAFIHTSWGNLNLRCGKYKHLQTKNKCSTYEKISIEFTREEYKIWCLSREADILSLKRPSLDRKDVTKNYSMDNIQIIELTQNIRKDKTVFVDGVGVCWACHKIKSENEFVTDNRRQNGKASCCKVCDNERRLLRFRNTGK